MVRGRRRMINPCMSSSLCMSSSPCKRHCAGILEQSLGAKNRVGRGWSYRPARTRIFKLLRSSRIDSKKHRLHRLAELIPWNLYLGSLKVKKYIKLGHLRHTEFRNKPKYTFYAKFLIQITSNSAELKSLPPKFCLPRNGKKWTPHWKRNPHSMLFLLSLADTGRIATSHTKRDTEARGNELKNIARIYRPSFHENKPKTLVFT
jgi:hypothetical protein